MSPAPPQLSLRRPLMLAFVLIAASVAVGLWAYRQLPPGGMIPTHFGLNGQPNGFMPAAVGLAAAPIMGAFVVLLLATAPAWSPGSRRGLAASGGAYGVLLIGVAGLFLALQGALAMRALDPNFDAMRWMFIGLGIFFVVIGALLGRFQPNSVAGIRTPWTLQDPVVWNRTHRFTGRLLVLGGVTLAGVAYIGADHADLIVALVVCVLGPAVAGAIYSRAIYRPRHPSDGGAP